MPAFGGDPAAPAIPGRRRAQVIMLVAAASLVFAALVGRMLYFARLEVRRAEASQDLRQKAQHYRRAAAYYVPGSPWVRQAVEALGDQAARADRRGDLAHALWVYRQLRSAILQLRGSTRPYAERLPEINRRIATLSATMPRAAAVLKTASGQSTLLARLDSPRSPRPAFVALGLLGFCLWVGGAFAALFWGLKKEGGRTRRFWPLLAMVAAGVVLFSFGLASA